MDKKEKDKNMYHFGLRLTIIGEDKFFGPGVSQLMHCIEKTGSLRQSCVLMGMAYSKAWKMLKTAEKNIGFPLVVGSTGGSGGGSSTLTEEGKYFLTQYDAFTDEAKMQIEKLFEKYFN